jgi:hypothetical protein
MQLEDVFPRIRMQAIANAGYRYHRKTRDSQGVNEAIVTSQQWLSNK